MNLESVRTFDIAPRLVRETERPLLEAGKAGYERFALWSGIVRENTFRVQTLHVPSQTSYHLRSGLCVKVDGDDLHRLNVWLYENSELLGVQIHTHPEEAYHSETDDAYPIATQLGALSIVVPDFCRRGLFTEGTAVYRLDGNGWLGLSNNAAKNLIRFTQ